MQQRDTSCSASNPFLDPLRITLAVRVQELFGWKPEELEGQRIEALVPEMYRAAHSGHRSRFVSDPHNRPMGVGLELRARRRKALARGESVKPVEYRIFDVEGNERYSCQ